MQDIFFYRRLAFMPSGKILSAILLFLFFAIHTDVAVACEDEVAALGGFSLAANSGDQQPAPVLKGEWTTSCHWGEVELWGLFSPVDKRATEAGFLLSGSFIFRRRLYHSLFITGGVGVNHRDAGQFIKTTLHPKVGLALRHSRQMLEVEWNFRENQTANGVEGAVLRFRQDLYPWERSFGMRMEWSATIFRFSHTGPNNTPLWRDTGAGARFLIGIVCCRREEGFN